MQINRHGAERIDTLEPLWTAIHSQNVQLVPTLVGAPRRPEALSWRRRRQQYQAWLAQPDSGMLIATTDGQAVGYAVYRCQPGHNEWDAGERVVELESLGVLPEARGRGVGSALVARVKQECEALGVAHLRVGTLVANTAAERFYQHHGFQPVSVALIAPIQPTEHGGR